LQIGIMMKESLHQEKAENGLLQLLNKGMFFLMAYNGFGLGEVAEHKS